MTSRLLGARVVADRTHGLLERPSVRKWIIVALWLAVLAAAVIRVAQMVADPTLPGEPWQSDGEFKDFRDVVWVPGGYVLEGGNPYDPASYLAAHPWAQQFSAYPPVWLLLGVLLAPVPFLVAGVLFQILALGVAFVLLRILCRWALPRYADLAVPIGLLWLNVWYPGRGALASLGSVLCVLGVVLVLRSVTGAATRPPSSGPRPFDWACALGVALSLVKPQFGVPVLAVAIAGGRLREAWRGTLALVLACVPPLVVVTMAAGGPIAFVQSIVRNQDYVWGPNTPGGLGSPFQRRFDIWGTLGHFGFDHPPTWLTFGVILLVLAVVVLAVRRTGDPFLLSAVVCGAMLIGVFHPWYDALLLVVPVVLGVGAIISGQLNGLAARLGFAAYALVVLHLHTVTTRVVPGLTGPIADTIDFFVAAAGLACAIVAVFGSAGRQAPAESPTPDGVAVAPD